MKFIGLQVGLLFSTIQSTVRLASTKHKLMGDAGRFCTLLAANFASRVSACTGTVEPFKHLLPATAHPQFLVLSAHDKLNTDCAWTKKPNTSFTKQFRCYEALTSTSWLHSLYHGSKWFGRNIVGPPTWSLHYAWREDLRRREWQPFRSNPLCTDDIGASIC